MVIFNRAVFYPPLIIGPPSSPFILELFPVPSLFYLSLSPLKGTLSTLSQLRSSFCSFLHSYRKRIGLIPSPLCLSCGVESHTTVHIFSCSSHPTSLAKLHLWERPRLASEFLWVLPFFAVPPFPPLELPSFWRPKELGQSSSSYLIT